MKTNFLPAIITILLYSSAADAQTSWQITGNSNITTSNFIGTTNKQPFIIKTNNTERLRILSNGNIGIGTKTPDNTLHIFKGSAGNVTGYPLAPLVVENSTACYMNLLAPDNTETGIFFGKPASNISGSIIYSNVSTPAGLQFRTGGNNIRMVIDSNGHAGINTLAPNAFQLKVSHELFGLAIEDNASLNHWEFATLSDGTLQLFFNGGAKGAFNSSNGVYTAASDERLKTNIKPMGNMLDKIKALKPSTYQFKNTSDKQEYNGFIAQDVMKIFPSLVTHSIEPKRNLDIYTLDYSGFGVIAIKGIQELQPIVEKQQQQIENQQQQIEKQQQEIDELKQMINKLSAASQSSSLNINEAYLQQNVPNPSSKNTTVRCYVPSFVTAAQLVIYNANGTQLKSFTVKSGINEININAGLLLAGEYSYALVVDGNKVDSKKMVIVK